MVTKAMKKRAGLYLSDESVILTQALIEQFLNTVKAGGLQPQTIRIYRRGLEDLYDFLPEKKEITKELLEDWREALKKSGYSECTINTKLVAVNGLLRYCGAEGLLAAHESYAVDKTVPEMTREEYLQFLSKVREVGSEKDYLLIKVLVSVDISVRELESLTVEACHKGVIYMSEEKTTEIPGCLREELLQYVDRCGMLKGPVFVTREGNPINRSNIANSIHRLAEKTGMDPDKCCPRALRRLYLTTQKDLRVQMHPLFFQAYENLLNMEQNRMAW